MRAFGVYLPRGVEGLRPCQGEGPLVRAALLLHGLYNVP